MMPDITIRDKGGNILAIIDTKWKMLNPEEPKYDISQSDIYQMFAYATQYQCQDIILLYPYHNATGENLPSLTVKVGGQRIQIKTVDICALADNR